MFEELGSFYRAHERALPDWKSELRPWADWAVARAAALNELRTESDCAALLATARELVQLLAPAAARDGPALRAAVAACCAGLRTGASALHESVLPPHAGAACDAARDIDHASVQLLLRMDGDYGDHGDPRQRWAAAAAEVPRRGCCRPPRRSPR